MIRSSKTLQCGALAGLVLLFVFSASAGEPLHDAVRKQLRNKNYLLLEDDKGARLFVFSTGNETTLTVPVRERSVADRTDRVESSKALEMTRSSNYRQRIRGLTLLSDVEDTYALDAALVLLSDPVVAVREEAVQLIIEHPGADIDSIVAIAANDPSKRVRQAAAELVEERFDDQGD